MGRSVASAPVTGAPLQWVGRSVAPVTGAPLQWVGRSVGGSGGGRRAPRNVLFGGLLVTGGRGEGDGHVHRESVLSEHGV